MAGISDHIRMARRRFDPKKVSKALGLKIRQMRHDRGWTLEDCEEHGWTNWRHLQEIESGKNITVHTLINLANLFGVHPIELLQDI
jgi:transcriptional regulator with XRE-family HTH domain